MKDFDDFRKTLNQETIERWGEEVQREVVETVQPQLEQLDPLEQLTIRSNAFNFRVTMRLLEAYHDWLNQRG